MTFSCKRCAYQWDAQKKDAPKEYRPKYCPHCKSPLWDKDYVRGPKKKIEIVLMHTPAKEDEISLVKDEWGIVTDGKPVSYAEQVRLAMEKLK